MSVWRGARHRALGKLDPHPDVHVDHDADDLEDLLQAEVLGSLVPRAPTGMWRSSASTTCSPLGIAESRLLCPGVKLGLPPRRQRVDLRPGGSGWSTPIFGIAYKKRRAASVDPCPAKMPHPIGSRSFSHGPRRHDATVPDQGNRRWSLCGSTQTSDGGGMASFGTECDRHFQAT
jgi:hypothetical protein